MPNTLSGNGSLSGSGTLETPLAIGSVGPGGGIIFYDAGSTLSWGRYMEVATASTSPTWTDSTPAWSGNVNTLVGGTSSAIGSGYNNTLLAVAQSSTAGKAITICRAYTGGGKTDWFLPSSGEMNALYPVKSLSGITMSNVGYLSSNETTATQVSITNFNDGNSSTPVAKSNANGFFKIRAIRYV